MNLRQIEAFRAVMTEGSVTQAAVALGVTQPAVSCLIGNLEDSLGFILFKRHRGRFQPTGEAEAFLEDSERLLASYSRTLRTVRDIRDLKSGSLRIAALPAVSMNFLPKLIAGFVRTRPQINVSLQTRSSVQIKEWVSAQLFDIGLAELPADSPAIDCERLSVDCLCALPQGHPLTDKARLGPKDLQGEPLIVPNPEHAVHYHLKAAFEQAGTPWAPHIESQLFAPICRMVSEGAGIAIV
ncbi:MAG: LysR family transcriptional regulator, partial [Rhodospirillales bacterium]|nr:LysR family transcriptional regulator [Rhodospirillales bacterium]